jgi:hypothetical protein
MPRLTLRITVKIIEKKRGNVPRKIARIQCVLKWEEPWKVEGATKIVLL